VTWELVLKKPESLSFASAGERLEGDGSSGFGILSEAKDLCTPGPVAQVLRGKERRSG